MKLRKRENIFIQAMHVPDTAEQSLIGVRHISKLSQLQIIFGSTAKCE